MTTTDRVIAYLRGADLARARRKDCAESMAMSGSTLRRRLEAENSAFTALLWAERKRRALELFDANRRACGKRLAQRMGYRHEQNAERAFKQLFGVTLTQYRAGL